MQLASLHNSQAVFGFLIGVSRALVPETESSILTPLISRASEAIASVILRKQKTLNPSPQTKIQGPVV